MTVSDNRPGPAESDDDHWEIYITYVDDRPAVILVDIGVSAVAPLPGLSKLVWLWVYLESPDDQGFPTDEEDEMLNDVEDAITDALEGIGTRYVGRITTDGRREFYFYASDTQPFYEVVSKAVLSVSDYQFEIDETDDVSWSHYQDVLFPTPEDFHQIRNQHVIARLQDEGDSIVKPRKVDHYANFKSETDREAFIAEAQSQGYETVSRPTLKDDAEMPYSVGLLREHAVDEQTIDEITFELFELAQKHHGEYDGWGSPVVK